MTARILRGCEPFHFDGGSIGFLLQHGFTGCPGSMRPIGEWLAERGATVVGPRLPGHGTTWEDLAGTKMDDWEREAEKALFALSERCSTVVAVGQSAGGALVLHLAAKHPQRVHGVVAINAYVRDPRLMFSFLIRPFTRTTKGVGNDIKKPGQDEYAYARIPLRVVPQLGRLIRTAARELPTVTAPLLAFSSNEDHVVKPANSEVIVRKVGSRRKEVVRLTNSYHVATLDYDAELIRARVLAFAESLSGARPASPA